MGPIKKAVVVAAALLAGLAASWALGKIQPPRAGTAQPTPAAHDAFRYRRIVCMAPSATEITFAIGAGDRVVGISQHTTHPPEALNRPRCGGFFNPSREAILSREPDLIVTQGVAADLTDFAEASGIDLVALDLTDLESITSQMRRLGRLLQVEAEAEVACAEMQLGLARVRARAARRPVVPAVIVIGHEPGALSDIYVVGSGTFLGDLLVAAGGRNVFADSELDYGIVSKEAILERAPEAVIELIGEGGDLAAQQRRVRELWAGLPPLPAVRSGRVFAIESTYAMIPGPRVVLLAERLAEALHPEAAP